MNTSTLSTLISLFCAGCLAVSVGSLAYAKGAIVFTATDSADTNFQDDPAQPIAPMHVIQNGTHTLSDIQPWLNHFQKLENNHQTELTEQYSPSATIQIHRIDNNGHESTEVLIGEEYQAMLTAGLELARLANDTQMYTLVEVISEGPNQVWAIAERKDLTSMVTKPIAWRLKRKEPTTKWKIIQEVADL
jgi:hypothetical protein